MKLESAPNFRDIGNCITKSGKKIKPGLIYRSDELSKITNKDLDFLKQLGIKLICDLRSPDELSSRPDKIINPEVRNINIPMNPQREDFNRKKLFVLLYKKDGNLDFDNILKSYYKKLAFECTAQIKDVIMLLSDSNNLPAIIHCTAGKDRTGFISAIIQLLAGVGMEDVIRDYLVTNLNIHNRTKKLVRYLRFLSLFRISEKRLQPMLEANVKYLSEGLDSILELYPDVKSYLIEACNIDGLILQNLLKNIIE